MRVQPENIVTWVYAIAQSDSQEAFKSLYLFYFQRLMRFTLSFISNLQEAEEIVSDTFLSLWENRAALPEVANPEAYLYTIARNKAISHLRSHPMTNIPMNESTDLFLYTETTPEEELISKESLEHLNAAINSLPEKCKLAFKLVREDKMKYKEVAQILNISVKTVEAHITTAVRKLREALSEKK